MTIYTITESPVYVRRMSTASSNIVNIMPVGSKLYVIGEEAGWYKTIGGHYVFKTDNIKPFNQLASKRSLSLNDGQGVAAAGMNTPINTTGQTSPSMGDFRRTDAEATRVADADRAASGDDLVNRMQQDAALTNSPVTGAGNNIQPGKVLQWGPDGSLARDANGNYIQIDPPAAVASAEGAKNNMIDRIMTGDDGQKYALITDTTTGGQYYVPLDQCRIGTSNIDGDISYDAFNNAEAQKQREQENSLIDQISSIGNSFISAWRGLNELTIEDTRSVFGMPYQFMPIVDPRLVEKGKNSSAATFKKLGRKYQEKIVARAPILYMQAGSPVFMRGYSDDAKAVMIDELLHNYRAMGSESELSKLLDDNNSQYYSFSEQSSQYFGAVNTACHFLAHMLNLEDVEIPGVAKNGEGSIGEVLLNHAYGNKLGSLNWSGHTEHQFGFYRGAVGFYINSDNQISESFSNATRQSQLAGKINQISDQAMEAMFVMGSLAHELDSTGHTTTAGLMNTLNDNNASLTDGQSSDSPGLLNSIVKNLTTLISGGKMIFPEIWADSNFGRSYNVNILLDSPECDTLSIYLNVLVPLAHVLGFVLPKSAGANTYVSPFLVRCFYKSTFHIDMGIITSCEIVKGDAGAWNADGLPTRISINLTIKDLYSILSQSMGVGSNTIISNPAQMEYLATMCGVNVAPASLIRSLELWWMAKGPASLRNNLVNTGTGAIQSVFRAMQNLRSPARFSI